MESLGILKPSFNIPILSSVASSAIARYTPCFHGCHGSYRYARSTPRISKKPAPKRRWTPFSCCQNSRSERTPNYNTRLTITPVFVLMHGLRDFLAKPIHRVRCTEGDDTNGVLECGGIGMFLLSTTLMAKAHISPVLAALAANPTFVSGLFAWAIAQSMKLLLNFCVEKKWDIGVLVSSGGMPSSHSALCTALTTSVALCHGISDSLFPVCCGFSLIVMYDATGVRRHAGMQAEVLNMIVKDLFQGHPVSERKLKELLGHTPSQVIAGAFLGMFVSYLCCHNCLVGL